MIIETVTGESITRVAHTTFTFDRTTNQVTATSTFMKAVGTVDDIAQQGESEEQIITMSHTEVFSIPGAAAFYAAFKDAVYAKRT